MFCLYMYIVSLISFVIYTGKSSSDGPPLGRQMSGSSPNILSNSTSPKGPKVPKQRDTASASPTVKP